MKFFYEKRSRDTCFVKRGFLSFNPHLHIQTEIVFIESGSSRCFIDGNEYILNEGDAAIVYPGRIHSYADDNNVLCYVLIADPDDYPELKPYFKEKAPLSPVIRKSELEAIGFKYILDIAYTEFQNGDTSVKKGCILITLGKLLSICALKSVKSDSSNLIDELLNYCQNHYSEKLTLSGTAKALHISTSYLSHIFSEKLTISFTDYINMLRTNDACTMLKSSNASITEISDKCGFSTIRTFNRAFLKHTGMTPREYRKL